MKLCVPIQAKTQTEALKKMKEAAKYADLAEVWLDQIEDLDLETLLQKKSLPVVCVCKRITEGGKFKGGDDILSTLLMSAIKNGTDYVDIPFSMSEKLSKKCIQEAQKKGTKVILSHHDFKETPDYPQLLKLADSMQKRKADVVKIACLAKNFQDTIHILALAKSLEGNIPHIIIAMGEKGILSRILSPTLGGEMMFAVLSKKGQTAEGQMTVRQLRKAWNMLSFRPPLSSRPSSVRHSREDGNPAQI